MPSLPSRIHDQLIGTSFHSAQPLNTPESPAQHEHPSTLSLAKMSEETLKVLEETTGPHWALANQAWQFIDGDAMHLQSAEGADAQYATASGGLSIQTRLNEKSRYDIFRIETPTTHQWILGLP